MNLFYLKRKRLETDELLESKRNKLHSRSQTMMTSSYTTKTTLKNSSLSNCLKSSNLNLENQPPLENSLKLQSNFIFQNLKAEYLASKEKILQNSVSLKHKSELYDDYISRIAEQNDKLQESHEKCLRANNLLHKNNADFDAEISDLENIETSLKSQLEQEQNYIKLASENLQNLNNQIVKEQIKLNEALKSIENNQMENETLKIELEELARYKEMLIKDVRHNVEITESILSLNNLDQAEKSSILLQISNYNG